MPSKSIAQQQAVGIAMAAKEGKKPVSDLRGASKQMYKGMSGKELHKFAATPHKGLPPRKALIGMNTGGTTNALGYPMPKACHTPLKKALESEAAILVRALIEDDRLEEEDEHAEVGSARNILHAVQRLQASLPNATPEQQHDLTTIRAAASSLVRMHEVV